MTPPEIGIQQTLFRYARAMDRMDAALALACFLPGAHIYYGGKFEGSPAEFVAWLWPLHAGMVSHVHSISNVLVEHSAERTDSEAYVWTTLRIRKDDGTEFDYLSRGRYLDRWHEVDGRWLIADRLYVNDMRTTAPVVATDSSAQLPTNDLPAVPSTRDRSDASYARLYEPSPTPRLYN